tara:strand:+ start:22849 stop:22965 length:117 start_codon:yes stop_codon:yes gene_type:complete
MRKARLFYLIAKAMPFGLILVEQNPTEFTEKEALYRSV